MSRCYSCGTETNKHLLGCPEYIFEKAIGMPSRKIPTADKVEVESFDFGIDLTIDREVSKYCKSVNKIQLPKVKKSFLPLETTGNTIPAGTISIIGGQPQILCKPYRLWIDETIVHCFLIHSIFIGAKSQFVAPGKIPANIFRTGRWPLPESPDKDLEFGIDLSTWDTIDVGQWFRMQVENLAGNPMPVRFALEVTCLV